MWVGSHLPLRTRADNKWLSVRGTLPRILRTRAYDYRDINRASLLGGTNVELRGNRTDRGGNHMNCKTCAGPCCLKGSNIPGDCEGYKHMSHYDQIRSMSVEEMATFIRDLIIDRNIGIPSETWLEWLRQEAEHE